MTKDNIIKVPDTGVITLKDTFYKSGDIVIPMLSTKSEVLLIYPKDLYEAKANTFIDILQKDVREEKLTPKEYRRLRRFYFGMLSYVPQTVSSKNTITLEKEIIKKLEIEDIAFITLQNKVVLLAKDQSMYERFIKERQSLK